MIRDSLKDRRADGPAGDGQRISMHADAEAIFRAGVRAVEPGAAVRRVCRREDERLWFRNQAIDLAGIDRVLVIGAGKATAAMAQAAAPAAMITLILSDVTGDDLDVIASGPSVPYRSTFSGCVQLIRRYGIEGELPRGVCAHLDNNDAYPFFETPGDLLTTGPTGTNVMDLNIVLIRK